MTNDFSCGNGSAIVDNRNRSVVDFLRQGIKPGSDLAIVSAYFTIYAYQALREVLEQAGQTRFLYGQPAAVGTPDPSDNQVKAFKLIDDGGMVLKQSLAQKPLARACASWINDRVEIRTIDRAGFLHGKLYHISRKDETEALVGSSNFTSRGLGLGEEGNVELNLELRNDEDRAALLRWFNDIWNDDKLTSDAKSEVLAALEQLGQPYAPEFVYYKTLFHVLERWLDRHVEQDGLLHSSQLFDSEIWKALYKFQRHGAINAINCLGRHNGCIIADSVGLGKTWTALAVIKFFELQNKRVLVLCPKRLEDNWVRYTAWAAARNNAFEKDRLGYAVRAHTDLSRYTGMAGSVDLSQFNWGSFDLIVIDESHNFRNAGRDKLDDAGNLVRHSRYNRLVEEALKPGPQTKVLMLTATPVNTSLRDLRNQIYLMCEKRVDAFRETLGIRNLQSMFNVAQRRFQEWEIKCRAGERPDKSALLELLGSDFLAVLDTVSIARSREHVCRYYPEELEAIGGFPKRALPRNLHPALDSRGELSCDDLFRRIGAFRLAVYNPSQYVKDTSSLDEERAARQFDQRDRERFLIGMMRVNLLKRLESSVNSFTLTMHRIIGRIKDIDEQVKQWRKSGLTKEPDFLPEEDEEDDEFVVGRRRLYRLEDLDIDRWQKDLHEDRQLLEELCSQVEQVTVEHDNKLAVLKQELQRKVELAPLDKDDKPNRKALVFTTFVDTAQYLYRHLEEWAIELDLNIALVTGGGENRSTAGTTQFLDILSSFAPNAQQSEAQHGDIDIVVATDCLSEGQNLQDCDLVINYDIHWNPVRLMQRFGRIDRLGSRNQEVAMTTFWPTDDLDRYLDLKNRVEARMVLADAAATGFGDPLSQTDWIEEEQLENVKSELTFRDRQLRRMWDANLDFEEADDSISLNDLTLDDFLADLLQYVERNKAALEAAPHGIYAVADNAMQAVSSRQSDTVASGVIFCLRHNSNPKARTPNRLWPYFLVYVRADGSVSYTFQQDRQCLGLFRRLASGQHCPSKQLELVFDQETHQGRCMKKYDDLLDAALSSIVSKYRFAELESLTHDRGAVIGDRQSQPNSSREFSLVTWLVIKESGTRQHND